MVTTSEPPPISTFGDVPCSQHPDVRTRLRCSRCGKPICPRCAVRTPVGLRCPDCAGVRGLPTYRTSGNVLAKAAGLGLLVAVPIGLLWGFFPNWQFYLALAIGFGTAEVIAKAANYKRGRDLQMLAIGIVVLGMILSRVVIAQRFGVTFDQINQADAVIFNEAVFEEYGRPLYVSDLMHLRLIPDLIYALFPIVISWIRFR